MRAANCMRDYGTTNNTPAHQAPPVWRVPEGLEDLTAAQVGDGGACQHTNDKPDRSGAPRGLRGLAGHHTDTPTDWRPQRGLRGLAAVPVGGGRAWPGFETTRRAQLAARTASGRAAAHRHTQRPGPTKLATRRQGLAGLREDTPSQSSAHPAPLVWRTPEGTAAVPVGGGGAAPPVWRTPRARPRCRWAAAGPGRASRPTTPSEARVWRSRGRGAAHRHQHAGTNTQAQTHRHNEAARPHRGPGGSRVRPLGSHQRSVQRIWVPVAPRRSQASTTRAAMPASADLPHVRGSYCFFTPTSPSILRTPS